MDLLHLPSKEPWSEHEWPVQQKETVEVVVVWEAVECQCRSAEQWLESLAQALGQVRVEALEALEALADLQPLLLS